MDLASSAWVPTTMSTVPSAMPGVVSAQFLGRTMRDGWRDDQRQAGKALW